MVAPASATLPAGGSVAVTVELNVAEGFHPGGRYTGEVRLDGAYEQCVCLILEVESPVVNRLRVEQGDPPLRLRAHRWYDHFQCAESCVVSRPAPTIPPGNVAPAVVVDRLDPAKG